MRFGKTDMAKDNALGLGEVRPQGERERDGRFSGEADPHAVVTCTDKVTRAEPR